MDDAEAMASFSEPVRHWFADAFGAPTAVQGEAWKAIVRGENAFVIAPTGSGKTLAAFLWAIDALMGEKARVAETGEKWVRGVRVLYVSPLKALGADVDRNLQGPLSAISELAAVESARRGAKAPEIRTAMRTGDTPADERRKIARNPPDILITTPESLYLMLTSAAREALRTVETVIVDEVHALAGDKRGAHLSLSLERLDDLLEAPAQRIGLSATVRPREEVARFLGGVRPVTVVATEALPSLDLSVRVPVRDMTAVPAFGGFAGAGDGTRQRGAGPRRAPVEDAWKSDRALRAVMAEGASPAPHPDSRLGSSSIWPHIEAAILDEVLAHKSTIVFVNSRGLCEKLTARLNELYAKRLGLDAPHSEVAGFWAAAGSGDATAFGDDAVRGVPTGADAMRGAPGTAFRSDIGSTTKLVTEPAVVIAKAHHGSVSKEKRLQVERELKAGELPCVVATSSLELGIDMGSIDLVLQVAAPPSVASGLQRVGRAVTRWAAAPRASSSRVPGWRSSMPPSWPRAWRPAPSRARGSCAMRSMCWPSRPWPLWPWRRTAFQPTSGSPACGGRPAMPIWADAPSRECSTCSPGATARARWPSSRRASCGIARRGCSRRAPVPSAWP